MSSSREVMPSAWRDCYLDIVRKIDGKHAQRSRMVGVIIKAALLAHFLQLVVEAADRTTCTPNYFRYVKDQETEIFSGLIVIPSPPKGVTLHLSVGMSIAAVLPSKYVGRLKLAESREQSMRVVQQGGPLKYNIRFPLRQPLPTITGLWFNNELLCTGQHAIGQIVTSIVLNHTLYPPGKMQVLDESNLISSHADVDEKLWQPAMPDPTRPPIFETQPTRPPIFETEPTRPPVFQTKPTRPPVFQTEPTRPPVFQPEVTRSSIQTVGTERTVFTPIPTRPQTTQPVSPVTPKPIPNIDQTNELCGRPSNTNSINQLIAGGLKTYPGQWPWLVAIFVVKYEFEFQCAGNLVTNTHVITAAHCFQLGNLMIPASVLSIGVGRYRLRGWKEKDSNRHVAEYRIHPDYRFQVDANSKASADSDLAVLILKDRVEYSAMVRPVCLWPSLTALDFVVGRSGTVVGWGRDEFGNPYVDEPRMSTSPIVSQEVCQWSNSEFAKITTNRTFCAGLRNGTGPCNGDSGSGFVIYDSYTERYYLRGIVSLSLLDRGRMSCDLSQFVVYADVAQYRDWILEQLARSVVPRF
ncbi:clotting factor B-like isoform X1 [Hylaeus volcanicus]|uniref:clotting factor B-like isoform X1 n=2 Tax=Hylaeus volcanicus TaxID=313075 RepID=UPI0023B83E95|nr:clotting factor B-like isoform X1 [Hylaeus volcanicus]